MTVVNMPFPAAIITVSANRASIALRHEHRIKLLGCYPVLAFYFSLPFTEAKLLRGFSAELFIFSFPLLVDGVYVVVIVLPIAGVLYVFALTSLDADMLFLFLGEIASPLVFAPRLLFSTSLYWDRHTEIIT